MVELGGELRCRIGVGMVIVPPASSVAGRGDAILPYLVGIWSERLRCLAAAA
jgi:hypothetical protein